MYNVKMERKVCTRCHENLPITSFYKKKRPYGMSYYSECKKCRREISDNYVNRNSEKVKKVAQKYYQTFKERISIVHKKYYYKDLEKTRTIKAKSAYKHQTKRNEIVRNKSKEMRKTFLEMYGNKCACCGETTYEFLTLEHKNGQRGIEKSRKKSGKHSYAIAIREYRPDLYEILCWNCNCSKGRYGYCPHHPPT